jgi:AhpD family alkylhydroperoxidase
VLALLRSCPRLVAVIGRSRVGPALRERIMVAVSRANACEACTRVHETWALRAGVSAAELEGIGAGELVGLSAPERAAVVYATALAEAHFGPIPPEIEALTDKHLDPERKRDIEAIARLMTLANTAVNTADELRRGLCRRDSAPAS